MEAIREIIEIPNNHKITISVPDYIKEKYAEVTIIFKNQENTKENRLIKNEFTISDKVKSVSGILKTDKDYKELRDEIIEERIQKYEDIL